MNILTSLNTLLQGIPAGSRATLDAIFESIRAIFGGDRDTRKRVAFGVAVIALSASAAFANPMVGGAPMLAKEWMRFR